MIKRPLGVATAGIANNASGPGRASTSSKELGFTLSVVGLKLVCCGLGLIPKLLLPQLALSFPQLVGLVFSCLLQLSAPSSLLLGELYFSLCTLPATMGFVVVPLSH